MKVVQLKKSSYHSGKIASQKSTIYTKERIDSLVGKSFDEILKYLEENGFRESIDKSYSKYQGFYLIEKFLNDHLSNVYTKIINSAPQKNRVLLEKYYLKYQIHNLMVLIRCKLSKEDEFEAYLIGDRRKRNKYVKAYAMSNIEDGISYICSKLGFDSQVVLKKYKENLFDLENYLYKQYYAELADLHFRYNKKDEKMFENFIGGYVDLINSRSFLRLKNEGIKKISFQDIYLEGGNLSLSFFTKLENKNVEDSVKEFSKYFNSSYEYQEFTDILHLDKTISYHKKKSTSYFKKISFGSPFYAFKFLFDMEQSINKLRILLKAKYLKLSREETEALL